MIPARHPITADTTTAQPPRTEASGVCQVVELEAGAHRWEPATGVVVSGYAYNALVPGPVIEAAVGDTLWVRLTNRLARPTALHWHGLRLPAAGAGGDDPTARVAPGDTVDYRLTLPDAGTFWYHPDSSGPGGRRGSDSGLYGALVVRDPADPPFDGEQVLVFADLHPDPGTGTTVVNGVRDPELQISAGHLERWRLVNASGSRFLRLSLGRHGLRILATGGGLLAAPHSSPELLLAPGDRYDVAVGPFPRGRSISLVALPDHGAGEGRVRRLATVLATTAERGSRAQLSGVRRDIPALAEPDQVPSRTLRLTPDGIRSCDAAVPVGRLQTWELVNDTSTDLPFFLRGFFFQVLTVDGTPPPYRSWKDTVAVPARGRVVIAWRPDDRPGWWSHSSPAPRSFEVVRRRRAAPGPDAAPTGQESASDATLATTSPTATRPPRTTRA